MQDHDREREVLLGWDAGRRDVARARRAGLPAAEPGHEHRPAERGDGDEDHERDPGERVLVGGLNAGDSPEKSLVFTFMQTYYQGERAMPPVDKNVASPVQAMMMMTSPVVTKRVGAQGNTRVAHLVKAGKSDDEILEELFLASLTRRPTADEVEVAKRVIAKDRNKGIENIQWALLNSAEFLVNH